MPETTVNEPEPANAPPVRFRPARANDMEAALPLILSSGPDAFNYVFRTARHTPEDFLRGAFVDGAGLQQNPGRPSVHGPEIRTPLSRQHVHLDEG